MDIVDKESDILIQINNVMKMDHYQPLHINLHIVKIRCTILQSKDLVHFTWILKDLNKCVEWMITLYMDVNVVLQMMIQSPQLTVVLLDALL